MDLVGKAVAITGAKSGIGEALSYEFARAGAMLVLIARDKKELVTVAEKAVRLGAKGANTYSADLSKPKDVFKLSKNILADFKEINILINNAGVGVYKDIESIDLPDWERSFMVNVITPFFLSKYLLPAFQKDSAIINIGSKRGRKVTAGEIVYCTSKFAMRGMSLGMANELEGQFPVTLITLGSVLTNFGTRTLKDRISQKMQGKPFFTPEEVAHKIVELVKADKLKKEVILLPK